MGNQQAMRLEPAPIPRTSPLPLRSVEVGPGLLFKLANDFRKPINDGPRTLPHVPTDEAEEAKPTLKPRRFTGADSESQRDAQLVTEKSFRQPTSPMTTPVGVSRKEK